MYLTILLQPGYYISGVQGHAIFWEPPSRASLGKHNKNFCNVPINNNHMSLWCGGIVVSDKYTFPATQYPNTERYFRS